MLCSCFKKSSTPATLCCNHQRYYQPWLNKGRMLGLHKLHATTCQAGDVINIFASVEIWLWLCPCFELLVFLCAKLLNNFLYLCWCVLVFNLLACGKLWRCYLKLHCLTHFRRLFKLPNVAYNAFWLILKWLFSRCLYSTFFCVFTKYWAKTRRALDCVFTIMAEISGRYWQILDRPGKKIILLSPLVIFKCSHSFILQSN